MDYLNKVWHYKYWILIAVIVSVALTYLSINKRYIPQRYEAKVEFRINSSLLVGILCENGREAFFDAQLMSRKLQKTGQTKAEMFGETKVFVSLDGSNKYTILTRSSSPNIAYEMTMDLFAIAKDSILAFSSRTPFGHQLERHENYIEILEKGMAMFRNRLMHDSTFHDKEQLLDSVYNDCMDSILLELQNIEPTESPLTILYETPKDEVPKSLSPVWILLLSVIAAIALCSTVILFYRKEDNGK